MSKRYTYAEAFVASKKYFNGNELSAKSFLDKYALRDDKEEIIESTPVMMHDRLAREFARIDTEKYNLDYEKRYNLYFEALDKFARIVPQGSPMAAIGNKYQRMSASNCVVVASPLDDMGSIIETGKELAQLYKRRCGVGLDISTLRPEGASVNNAARTTSGAWSFADFFSYITRMVGQNSRRGALMVTISVHHPDVLKFIKMKHDKTKVTGANISIRLSDEFLKAVEADEEYEVRWPIEGSPKIQHKLRAKEVWDEIINSATLTAEPGLIMWDNMINNLPAHCYPKFHTISTNPCSEIALSAYDSCRLISINLTGYVRKAFEKDAYFDHTSFQNDVRLAMHMADNLVDLELELIDRIKEVCSTGMETNLWNKLYAAGFNGRRTGLGTHGVADALAQLNLRYDSDEAIKKIDAIYSDLRDSAYDESINLSKTRGPFPVFDFEREKDCAYIKRLPVHILEKMQKYGRRNIALLTQAPTGTVSLLSKVGEFDSFNVSSGVEPVFMNEYVRRKKINPGDQNARIDFVDEVGDSWQEFTIYHSNVDNYHNKFPNSVLPDFFVTSDQIDGLRRVELQGIEQQYLDHSISSTINLPRGTKPEVVGKLYFESWKKGLKGVTVYVDGSRDGVLISKKDMELDEEGRPLKIGQALAPKRPKELLCEIHHATVRGVKWTVLVGLLQGEPYELFMGNAEDLAVPTKCKTGKIVKIGKGNYNLQIDDSDLVIKNIIKTSGDDDAAWATRMISTSLRHGIAVEYLVEQLSKSGSIVDINNVLARILRKYIKENQDIKQDACPMCGKNELIYEEKCKRCINDQCLWSGCS